MANKTICISADEYAQFLKYQELVNSHVTTIAESGKSTKCLLSSSSKWVIDSGATEHMTGNPNLFSTFQPHSSTPHVTLADGSTSRVLGSGIVNPIPSLSLSSVLSLPNFSFNLLSVSKLTRDLNCVISFFPDHCLFQDLTTKRIIGRGHESGGLYVLESPRPVACSSVLSPFEVHCRLGHPSLSSLKKLYPQFNHLSVLDCESCQFAKHHRLPSSPRVNKRATSPFDGLHLHLS